MFDQAATKVLLYDLLKTYRKECLIKTEDWDIVTSYSDVDSAWAAWFNTFLYEVCNKHAPIREKKIRGISLNG